MRSLILLCFTVFLLRPTPIYSLDPCTLTLFSIGSSAALGAAPFYAGKVAEFTTRNFIAYQQNRKYIGFGILYNKQEILNLFNREEKEVLESPTEDTRKKIRIINTKLNGDFDYLFFENDKTLKSKFQRMFNLSWDPLVKAEDLFNEKTKKRGICRHKALVMSQLLNDLGIKAEFLQVEVKVNKSWDTHCVVFFPSLDMVADPTAGKIYEGNHFFRHWKKI